MGRPSGLGSEEYHNRSFPLTEFTPGFDPGSTLLDPPHCSIIEHMVHFSRLIRQVCIDIYLPQNSAARTVELAQHLDQRFDGWLAHLPEPIRPRLESDRSSKIGSHKEAMWMKRQKLVLNMRKWPSRRAIMHRKTDETSRISQPPNLTLRVHSAHFYTCREVLGARVIRVRPEMPGFGEEDHRDHPRDIPPPGVLPHMVSHPASTL